MDFESTLQQLREKGNFRQIPEAGNTNGYVDFSSNDYLGLASKPELQEEFMSSAANRAVPLTSSASRLLAGRQDEYHALESLLESLYPGRRALLFNSGYHANTGLISAIADRHSLIIADRLVHASIIDGIVLSRAEYVRFAHNNFDELHRILSLKAHRYPNVVVAVESVYSMDGDRADISRLIDLKHEFPNIILYVDEAHAFGVLGQHGLGLVSEVPYESENVDIMVGTFGKAAASSGAFAVMSPLLRDIAVNRARSFIFSTALPPVCAAWTQFVISRIVEMDQDRQRLLTLSQRLQDGLKGLHGAVEADTSARYIYPFIVGDAQLTVELSRKLMEDGLKVLPIRTPTVPAGTERLRISLTAAHTDSQIDMLVDSIKRHSKC